MIKSILDNDLYKFTMQQAVLALYPDAQATYKFINRRPEGKLNDAACDAILRGMVMMDELRLTDEEAEFLSKSCPFMTTQYIEYLRNFRFDSNQIKIDMTEGELEISVSGPWHSTILWEVPLMALVSDAYFKHVDTDWNIDGQPGKLLEKGNALNVAGLSWACFSTRRRRDYDSQDRVVRTHKHFGSFAGTSNVHFAMKHGVKPIGTQAHEWIMAHSVLCGLRHANRYSLRAWNDVYKGDLGIALTDTYGTEAFFKDFGGELARMYDGVRHDSGSPFLFADKVIAHYKSLRIDPKSKVIVFSDGLDVETAIRIGEHVNGAIKVSFGIGTNLSNDYMDTEGATDPSEVDHFDLVKKSKPLNIVIKLTSIDGIPVVKLSDEPGKATGALDALRVARWTFLGQDLLRPPAVGP